MNYEMVVPFGFQYPTDLYKQKLFALKRQDSLILLRKRNEYDLVN